MDARWLVKLEATATAFRMIVTVAAGLLALAILADVTANFAILSALLLILVALAGPAVHGWLAHVLRAERSWALEATLIATGALWVIDLGAVLAAHFQNVTEQAAWAYWVTFGLVSVLHLAALVIAGILFARKQAEEETEPDSEADAEPA